MCYLHSFCFEDLLNDMITEEQLLKERIEKSIQTCQEELKALCHELSLEPETFEDLTVLQLEKKLRLKVDMLTKEKNERFQELKQLQKQDEELCTWLCSTPYYIPTGCVPSRQQLEELKEHIKSLQEEKEQRAAVFIGYKEKINQYMKEIGHSPDNTFECDVVYEDEDAFLLTTENIKALKVLLKQVKLQLQMHVKKTSNPNRFVNRGGSLLREEKERTRVQRLLPKLEEELKTSIQKWEAEQGGIFLVKGKRFMDCMTDQWDQYRIQKERVKYGKIMNKDSEGIRTPTKRPYGGPSTMVTPNKTRKLNVATNSTILQATASCSGNTFHSVVGKPPNSARKTPYKSRLVDDQQRLPLQECKDRNQISKITGPLGSYTEFMNEFMKKSNTTSGLLNSTTNEILNT
nr:PREDICTED: protein regulator of cytokinesis 1-like [Latimeria chalumnae]|eukprot:XP_014353475.1 PREDICTED: protein regulator of cytokinesis 1-like [Latimeria chalumnae]